MKCFHCDESARSVYSSCGRALRKEHMTKAPAILISYVGEVSMPMATVADALYWGVCKPQPKPIGMPELH